MGSQPTGRCEAWHLARKCIENAKDEYQIAIFLRHLDEIRTFAEAKLAELRFVPKSKSLKKVAPKKPAKKPTKKPTKRK